MNAPAQVAGDNAYTQALQNSAQIVGVARQAREAAQAREAWPAILEQSAKELGLTPAQYAAIKALPPDQGREELGKIALARQNRNAFTTVSAGDGNIVITNNADGSYQVINTGNGTSAKATPHVLPDSTIAMISKDGRVVAHVDANGRPVTTSGVKPSPTGGAAVNATSGANLSASLHQNDVNGLFSAKDKDGNDLDLLAPPDTYASVPARSIATYRNAFTNNPVIKELQVRSNEHANIVANINSPNVGPLDRAQKDVSLLMMYAHMLNPTVSVHESSVDALKQAVPMLSGETRTRFEQYVKRLNTGESLTPAQRESILRESGVMAHGTINLARNFIGQTAAAMRAQGIHPGLVVFDPTNGVDFGDESGALRGGPGADQPKSLQDRAAAILQSRK